MRAWMHDAGSGAAALIGFGPDRDSSPERRREKPRQRQERIYEDPSELKNLQKLISRESERLGARINDINYLKRDNGQREAEIEEMQDRIRVTKEEIVLVEQDLKAMQTRGPDDAAMSSQEVVEHFKQIHSHIVTISKTLETWHKPLTSKSLSKERARRIREHVRRNPRMKSTELFIQSTVNKNLSFVTEALIVHNLCSLVMYLVFFPFLPGKSINDPAMKMMSEMQRTVRTKQSQVYSSRWRALTYKHATVLEPRTATWCRDRVTSWVKQMSALLEVITDTKLGRDLLETTHQLTVQMIGVAAQFSDKSNQLCTEVDHFVFLPVFNQEYRPNFMREAFPTTAKPTKVILGLTLGLQLSSTVTKDSECTREFEYPILSHVLSDSSSVLSRLG